MRDVDVAELCRNLAAAQVRFWLVGGWGVDALLGRQTRPHHDVDLLVEVGSVERFRHRLEALGFDFAHVWEGETRCVHDDSWNGDADQPTAFVHRHADGREVDVHVVRVSADGAVTVLWNVPFPLTMDALRGEGVVAGRQVPCMTAEMQRKAHTGYDLRPEQVADLQLLEGLA